MLNRSILVILLLTVGIALQAQVLRQVNFKHLYNPDQVVFFTWEVIRENNTLRVFYDLQLTDSSRLDNVVVTFESRESLNDRAETALAETETKSHNSNFHRAGTLTLSAETNAKILLAKVKVVKGKSYQPLFFYKKIPTENSIYGKANNRPVSSYIHYNEQVRFSGFQNGNNVMVSYYEDAFPAAAPAFSVAQARVAKIIKPDSIFTIDVNAPVLFQHKGLYLVQQDTASRQGIAFRLEYDYPKLGKLESLAGPLVYICTSPEYEKIKTAKNDKRKFDQVILSITGNAERARIFMRNYFKRVESANQYFSSYKEGWKTDRGMVYIIYGVPDEVYLFEDREVWEYKNDDVKERFQFVKSATIFDPENYVLIRQKSYTDDWYYMIDLWRKARF